MGDFKSASYALCIACIAVVLRGADYFGLGSYGGTAILAIAFLAMMVYARYTHDYLDFPAAAMYNTDTDKTLNVHGCTLTEEPIDFDAIVARFLSDFVGDEGTPVHPDNKRWVSTIASNPVRWPYWITPDTVPALDATYHFRDHGSAASFEEIERFVGANLSTPIDTSRPLWQFHVWTRIGDTGGGVYLIKYHHAMADGFTMMRVVLSKATRLDGRPMADGNAPPPGDAAAVAASAKARAARKKAMARVTPVSFPAAVGKMLLLPQDPAGPLKASTVIESRKGGPVRVVAGNWAGRGGGPPAGVSIAKVKAIGRGSPFQATVNDVLMAALAGALRRHVDASHAPDGAAALKGVEQACLWVNLNPFATLYKPTAEVPLAWGDNALGAVYLKLPLELDGAAARLEAATTRVRALTRSPEPFVANVLMPVERFWAAEHFFQDRTRALCTAPLWPGFSILIPPAECSATS